MFDKYIIDAASVATPARPMRPPVFPSNQAGLITAAWPLDDRGLKVHR
jgi:hypothetical protein